MSIINHHFIFTLESVLNLQSIKYNFIVLNSDFFFPSLSKGLLNLKYRHIFPSELELIVWENTIEADQKILKILTNCLSDVTVLWLTLFIISCSLADYWQTQSFCFHKELMKRTIGKPTYAFEARDYVVSSPVTVRLYSHSTGTNPIDLTKTGDRMRSVMLPSEKGSSQLRDPDTRNRA